ncbi:hypothetical protein BJ546DRAFT_394450 [Cryomyces antarcticus]
MYNSISHQTFDTSTTAQPHQCGFAHARDPKVPAFHVTFSVPLPASGSRRSVIELQNHAAPPGGHRSTHCCCAEQLVARERSPVAEGDLGAVRLLQPLVCSRHTLQPTDVMLQERHAFQHISRRHQVTLRHLRATVKPGRFNRWPGDHPVHGSTTSAMWAAAPLTFSSLVSLS